MVVRLGSLVKRLIPYTLITRWWLLNLLTLSFINISFHRFSSLTCLSFLFKTCITVNGIVFLDLLLIKLWLLLNCLNKQLLLILWGSNHVVKRLRLLALFFEFFKEFLHISYHLNILALRCYIKSRWAIVTIIHHILLLKLTLDFIW